MDDNKTVDREALGRGHKTMDREALGRSASLGELYDARRDHFTSLNIFKTKIPEEAIDTKGNAYTDIVYTLSDTLEEKFKQLDIKGDIGASILCGLIEGKGSASFLSESKQSAKSVRGSLHYKSRTKVDILNIHFESLTDAVSAEALEYKDATHVVIGISWGANATISFEYANFENIDKKEIEGALRAQFEKIAPNLGSGNIRGEYKQDEQATRINFKMRIFADIMIAPNEPIPQSPQQAIEFLQKIPTYLEKENQGKGKPLSYKVVPLSVVRKRFKLNCSVDHVLRSLDETVVVQFIRLFDELEESKQKLFDLHEDLKNHEFCIDPEDIASAAEAKDESVEYVSQLKSKFQNTLVAVRSGKAGYDELNKLRSECIKGRYSAVGMKQIMRPFTSVIDKIELVKFFKKEGVKYVGERSLLESEKINNHTGTIYILYFGSKYFYSKKWVKTKSRFLSLIESKCVERERTTFFAVDLDLCQDVAEEEEVGDGLRLCEYKNGKYTRCDMVAAEEIKNEEMKHKGTDENKKKREKEDSSSTRTCTACFKHFLVVLAAFIFINLYVVVNQKPSSVPEPSATESPMSSNWNAASEILNSKEMRLNMVEDLKSKSNLAKLINKSVLNAMEVVPRHLFIDEQRLSEFVSTEPTEKDVIFCAYTYNKPMPATANSIESSPEITGTLLSLTEIVKGQAVLLVGIKGGYIQSLVAQLVGFQGSVVTVTSDTTAMGLCQDRVNFHCPWKGIVQWVYVENIKNERNIVEEMQKRKMLFHTIIYCGFVDHFPNKINAVLHSVGKVFIMAPVKTDENYQQFQRFARNGEKEEFGTITGFGVKYDEIQ